MNGIFEVRSFRESIDNPCTYLTSWTASDLLPTTVRMSLSFLVISLPNKGLLRTTTRIFGGSFGLSMMMLKLYLLLIYIYVIYF